MDRRCLIFSILFLLIVGIVEKVNGMKYKWVPLKTGDPLPDASTLIQITSKSYVGRARHFDEVLLAEITANESAVISSCNKEIFKNEFEILTTVGGSCKWKFYETLSDIQETAVRAGTAWNGEPIFVGAGLNVTSKSVFRLSSIYLTIDRTFLWSTEDYSTFQYLSCNITNEWVDSSAMKLPNNSVCGGKSEEGYDIYVARLKRGCDVVTGQVIPDAGTATAILHDGTPIQAAYCQVLVGKPEQQYSWVSASSGEIPDYAVVHGKNELEMSYVAQVNKAIRHWTHSEALASKLDYDILVMD